MKEEYVKTQVLEKGQVVRVWLTDTGHFTLKKSLLILIVIIETVGENVVRTQVPRHEFRSLLTSLPD